jgi:hypothetical protein
LPWFISGAALVTGSRASLDSFDEKCSHLSARAKALLRREPRCITEDRPDLLGGEVVRCKDLGLGAAGGTETEERTFCPYDACALL